MKSKVNFFIYFICILCFNLSLYAQDKMIKLEVDTENINADNIAETATFGQPAETSNEDYTLEVNKGDIIIWKGSSTPSSGGVVRIKLFKHEYGVELLGEGRIKEQNGTGVIVGRVQAGNPGDTEKYTIRFEVKRRGSQTWDSYEIDPKLKLSM